MITKTYLIESLFKVIIIFKNGGGGGGGARAPPASMGATAMDNEYKTTVYTDFHKCIRRDVTYKSLVK